MSLVPSGSFINTIIAPDSEKNPFLFFLFYRALDIEINYQLLKYWNLKTAIAPLLFQVFSSFSFRCNIYSFEFRV